MGNASGKLEYQLSKTAMDILTESVTGMDLKGQLRSLQKRMEGFSLLQ